MEIVRGVDLEVRAGDIVGVLGPSGAGKTTLFRALAGVVEIHHGEIRIAEQDVSLLPLWRRARHGLGYVPQGPSVLWDLTVHDNVATYLDITKADGSVRSWCEQVELDSKLGVAARDLSGGERRRLELLRAATARPNVWLCDEPLAAIDPKSTPIVARLLRDAAADGAAVVLSDHRVREALSMCTRALLYVDGRFELEAPPEEFIDHPQVRQRYLG